MCRICEKINIFVRPVKTLVIRKKNDEWSKNLESFCFRENLKNFWINNKIITKRWKYRWSVEKFLDWWVVAIHNFSPCSPMIQCFSPNTKTTNEQRFSNNTDWIPFFHRRRIKTNAPKTKGILFDRSNTTYLPPPLSNNWQPNQTTASNIYV